MNLTLQAVGLFLVIAVVLQFTAWAEDWLRQSSDSSGRQRLLNSRNALVTPDDHAAVADVVLAD